MELMTQTVAKICNSDSNYSTRYAEGETKVDSEEVEGVVDLEINERSKNVIGVRDIKMISDTGNNKVEKVDSPRVRSAEAIKESCFGEKDLIVNKINLHLTLTWKKRIEKKWSIGIC